MRRLHLFLACLAIVLPGPASAAENRTMTVDDLLRIPRVSDAQISPDGKTVTYVLTEVDLANNRLSSGIWLTPSDGGTPTQLTNTVKKDGHPRWSPDGKH